MHISTYKTKCMLLYTCTNIYTRIKSLCRQDTHALINMCPAMKDKKHGLNHSIRKLSRLIHHCKKEREWKKKKKKQRKTCNLIPTYRYASTGRKADRQGGNWYSIQLGFFFVFHINVEWRERIKKRKTLLLLLIYIPIIMLFLTLD